MTSYKTMLKEIEQLEQQLKGGAGSGNWGHGGRPGKRGGSVPGKGGGGPASADVEYIDWTKDPKFSVTKMNKITKDRVATLAKAVGAEGKVDTFRDPGTGPEYSIDVPHGTHNKLIALAKKKYGATVEHSTRDKDNMFRKLPVPNDRYTIKTGDKISDMDIIVDNNNGTTVLVGVSYPFHPFFVS